MLLLASAIVLALCTSPISGYGGGQTVLQPDNIYKHSSQWTTFNHTIKRVAVIGAGPSGLQIAASLVKHNFTVRVLDRAPGPGGNWFYTDEVPVRESYP